MKKITSWLFAAMLAIVLPLSFTACGPDPVNPDDPIIPDQEDPAAIALTSMGATYFGDALGNKSEVFIFQFNTGDVAIEGQNITGTGEVIFLQVIAESQTGLYPKAAEYAFDEEAAPGTVTPGFKGKSGPGGCYVLSIVDGEVQKAYNLVAGGKVTIAGKAAAADMKLHFELDDNRVVDYFYKGAIEVEDKSPKPEDAYKVESTEVTTVNYTVTDAKITNYGEGTIGANIENEAGEYASILFKVAADAKTLAPGTYPINATGEANTCMASPGFDGKYVYPTFVGTLNADGYIETIWFVTSGNVTVTENSITLAGKSFFGSTINATYTGEIVVKDAKGAPARVMTKSAPMFSARPAVK